MAGGSSMLAFCSSIIGFVWAFDLGQARARDLRFVHRSSVSNASDFVRGAGSAVEPTAHPGPKNEMNFIGYMKAHPNRAYFANLFFEGGFSSFAEVGVAGGRFSEHMLIHGRLEKLYLVEPEPEKFASRYSTNPADADAFSTWKSRGIGKNTDITVLPYFSLDERVLNAIPLNSVDLIYLDGAHDYNNVKKELEPFFARVAPGGMLAGHDYQFKGEFEPLPCNNCETVPGPRPYTDYGRTQGHRPEGNASSQQGVVRAVQEWLLQHPELTIHYTDENFTRESLAADGFDYDLVVTTSLNPSWYIWKPIDSKFRDQKLHQKAGLTTRMQVLLNRYKL
eukprot:gene825-92_t